MNDLFYFCLGFGMGVVLALVILGVSLLIYHALDKDKNYD